MKASDELLAARAALGCEASFGELVDRTAALRRWVCASYFLAGGDRDDLEQESLIALAKAVQDFRPAAGASFRTFAELCVRRHVITAVKMSSRAKHQVLTAAASLHEPLVGDPGATLADVVADRAPAAIDVLRRALRAARAGEDRVAA